MHMTQQPPPLSTFAPDAPLELVTLVHQMLQKERSERPSMAETSGRLLQLRGLDWGHDGGLRQLSGAGRAAGFSRPPASGWGSSAAHPAVAARGLGWSVAGGAVWPCAGLGMSAATWLAMWRGHVSGHVLVTSRFRRSASVPRAAARPAFSRVDASAGALDGSQSIHPPPSRRRWFVGVAIVTGFVVAAPLWWLIDQHEGVRADCRLKRQEPRRAELPASPPGELRPSSPSVPARQARRVLPRRKSGQPQR